MTYPRWVENIVDVCMAIRPGEKVLLITDEPMAIMRQQLVERIAEVGVAEMWSYTVPDATRPLPHYPAALYDLVTKVDVVLIFEHRRNPEIETPRALEMVQAIESGEARFASGPMINPSILEHELSADYQHIAMLTNRLGDQLDGRSHVRVTTKLGTDLEMDITGRKVMRDTGLFHLPRQHGNLPAGECFVAPIEDRTNGVFVVDKSYPGILIEEPIRLTVERGRVVKIDGGREAQRLTEIITEGERKPYGEGCRVVCELGIGTNPNARLQGNVLTDEKVMGTVHIAIGLNALESYGGQNRAPIHLDGVIGGPTLVVDGKTLIKNGDYRV
ncbi:MAG: aminopeptidase [Chloroflexi bacterium]|nr:aminopeptidase [Chloroflexota bacterium]